MAGGPCMRIWVCEIMHTVPRSGPWQLNRAYVVEMGESDRTMHIQRRGDYESIEEPLEESEKRRGCRCKLDGSVIKLIGATLCIAGAIATCTLSYYNLS